MPSQISSLTEWIFALCTFVQFRSSVGKQMSLQIISLTEWFVAFSTFVQLLSSMSQFMHSKLASAWIWLNTHGAKVFSGHVQDLNCPPQLVKRNWGNEHHFPFLNLKSQHIWDISCSSFLKACNVKSSKYTFLWQDYTEYQDFFSLCKIDQPAMYCTL